MRSADQTLGFLVADLSRAYRRVWGPMIAKHGITAGIFPFLRIIAERDGLTFRELADAVHMRGPTTVGIVAEMESRGLVRRERNAADGRKVNLFLTAAGRRAWTAVLPEVTIINGRAESGLSTAEKTQLKHLLRRVRSNFDLPAVKGSKRGTHPR